MTLCPTCQLPITGPHDGASQVGCLKAMEKAMTDLLKNAGHFGTCTGCYEPIVWIRHTNGKNVPYTTEGLNHFVNCKAREQFGKKGA